MSSQSRHSLRGANEPLCERVGTRRAERCLDHPSANRGDHLMKELVNLRTEQVDLEARRISLVGKGRKPRVIPIPHLLADVLGEYLEELRPSLPKSAYLFANPRGDRSLRGRYGPRALHNLVVEEIGRA